MRTSSSPSRLPVWQRIQLADFSSVSSVNLANCDCFSVVGALAEIHQHDSGRRANVGQSLWQLRVPVIEWLFSGLHCCTSLEPLDCSPTHPNKKRCYHIPCLHL